MGQKIFLKNSASIETSRQFNTVRLARIFAVHDMDTTLTAPRSRFLARVRFLRAIHIPFCTVRAILTCTTILPLHGTSETLHARYNIPPQSPAEKTNSFLHFLVETVELEVSVRRVSYVTSLCLINIAWYLMHNVPHVSASLS